MVEIAHTLKEGMANWAMERGEKDFDWLESFLDSSCATPSESPS
jgi:hypothetical protein